MARKILNFPVSDWLFGILHTLLRLTKRGDHALISMSTILKFYQLILYIECDCIQFILRCAYVKVRATEVYMCFCKGDLCNSSRNILPSLSILIPSIILIYNLLQRKLSFPLSPSSSLPSSSFTTFFRGNYPSLPLHPHPVHHPHLQPSVEETILPSLAILIS